MYNLINCNILDNLKIILPKKFEKNIIILNIKKSLIYYYNISNIY